LELLSQLGLTKHGYNYLELNDTLKKLAGMLEGDDILTIQLCEPGNFVSFFFFLFNEKLELNHYFRCIEIFW
jgi:hypothetical protein